MSITWWAVYLIGRERWYIEASDNFVFLYFRLFVHLSDSFFHYVFALGDYRIYPWVVKYQKVGFQIPTEKYTVLGQGMLTLMP